MRTGQSIVRDSPKRFILKRVNRSWKQASENVGAEGIIGGGVNVSSLVAGPEVEALVQPLLGGHDATFFSLVMLQKKNAMFRTQKYEIFLNQ